MSGVKHTPGPWVSERSVDEWGVSVIASNEKGHISNPTRGQVCHISFVAGATGDNPDLALANARLIASAPDLLEALVEHLAINERHMIREGFSLEQIECSTTKARAAIARARGEQDGGAS